MIPNFIVSIHLLISAIDKQYIYPLPRTINIDMISLTSRVVYVIKIVLYILISLFSIHP